MNLIKRKEKNKNQKEIIIQDDEYFKALRTISTEAGRKVVRKLAESRESNAYVLAGQLGITRHSTIKYLKTMVVLGLAVVNIRKKAYMEVAYYRSVGTTLLVTF